MTKDVVGIDIGTTGLRAVEVRDAGKAHPKLVRYHQVSLPEGAVNRGEVAEPNTVAAALKTLWSTGGFKSKNVVLGIGNHRALARDLAVPKMPMKRIRETLPFLVADMLPVPVAEALLDFYPINESEGENGPEINGLLIVAVKEAVQGNIAAVQLAGLTALEVDLIPFAVSRAVCRGTSFDGAVALIDVGQATTSVVITLAGVPQFVRLIPAGGGDLTQALVLGLSVDAPTAESVKREHGLAGASTSQAPETSIITEATSDLLNSLRNTVNYFSNTRPHIPVTGIVLSGGGAQLGGFTAALGALTRLPILPADPFASVALGRGVDAAALHATNGAFNVALGLALGSGA
ncbi:pilus assembly protein PilM [Cryobacterium roopkundense]|uniref:Pilus assembly protein PilM n=1 Tax=Cryobacterium roopkundense TaxID=1001240 RepID=A0A099JX96_9MICO|nr:type IV pilus assembly protein PilM [Cryobacterium roopkundense]KGJ82352.1 pilus assembly protein PilM [Cryobacterium roopkundense]MBB5639515.1 type IV pilus assembly protein PilM [Cryobacterium roopkundense]